MSSMENDISKILESFDNAHLKKNPLGSITGGLLDPSKLESKSIKERSHAPAIADSQDFTVIRYGTNISIQGSNNRYLESVSTTVNSMIPDKSTKSSNVYVLGVRGQGIGEASDSLVFVNSENRDDAGPLKYGSVVSIKSRFSNDRYLGIKESKIGFFRPLIGQGEKWIILKAKSRMISKVGVTNAQDVHDNSIGSFVRIGDSIMLLTSGLYQPSAIDVSNRGVSALALGEQMLALSEGSNGSQPILLHRTGRTMGEECWRIELFNTQANPVWAARPYLSGNFLLTPPNSRHSDTENIRNRRLPNSSINNITDGDAELALNTYSLAMQERILIRELLLALSGIEGQFIRVIEKSVSDPSTNNSSRGLRLSAIDTSKRQTLGNISLSIDLDSADRSLANQVMLLLPLCESAIQIRYFLRRQSNYEFGLVSHTVVAHMKQLLREYDVLVAQLEHLEMTNKLTLQKMIFLLQSAKVSLQVLHKLARDVHDSAGGKLLDVLYESYLSQGDEKAKQIIAHILEKASGPFLTMLSQWIYRGELKDLYNEFMVQSDPTITKEALADDFNAQYWENRYSLRESHVPRFLKQYAPKILTTGKYLNVVRDCIGQSLSDVEISNSNNDSQDDRLLPQMKSLVFNLETGLSSLFENIDNAYNFSSRALLRLLEENNSILSHFTSLRRFFLLEHGDFFIQFMDIADSELKKDVSDISLPRIQNLLQLSLQSSTLSLDSHKEELDCNLASHNLIQHLLLIQTAGESSSTAQGAAPIAPNKPTQGLKGHEALTLDYKVEWPVSIVLSRRAITKYQLLSRLLYFSKHVERRLLNCWQDHQSTRQLLDVRGCLGSAYCLRQRMLHFLQNFVYYMTLEVISPRSHEMTEGMKAAEDIDQVLYLHEKFLDTCLKECLLASNDLLKILTKIMSTCLLFADTMKQYIDGNDILEESRDNSMGSKTGAIPDIKVQSFLESTAFTTSGNNDPSTAMSNAILKQRALKKAYNEKRSRQIVRDTTHEAFTKTLARFTSTLDEQLREFLQRLWIDSYRHQPQLANLCVRLDYNGFYSGKFDANSANINLNK